MNLPRKITPDPLLITPMEIRFILKDNDTNIVAKLLPLYNDELFDFESIAPVPPEAIKQNPDYLFRAQFRLKNEKFALSFGKNVFLIETVGTYPLWDVYFDFIKRQTEKLLNANIIQSIIRIGLRFSNIFEERNVTEVLKYIPNISIPGYHEKITLVRFDLLKDQIALGLQIADNAKFEKPSKLITGVFIDIDAYYTTTLTSFQEVIPLINRLHTEEKELFFEILNPAFLETLNPEYDV